MLAAEPSPLEMLQQSEAELHLPPGWEPPATVVSVENLFKSPLTVPTVSKTWLDRIESSTGSASLFGLPYEILTDTAVAPIVLDFQSALAKAQPLLKTAMDSVAPEDRRLFLEEMGWPDEKTGLVQQDISAKSVKAKFEHMTHFKQKEMLKAAALIMAAADQTIQQLHAGLFDERPRRVKTPQGIFLVGGRGDDVYTENDLKDVAVLIDLGGKNVYEAPPAAARDGEIRVVIDMGQDIVIRTSSSVAGAGSGIFGIGLFYAPTAGGKKEITSGSFSQGCGLGGVGGLFIDGQAHLEADQYVQGAAAYGVGLLDVKDGDGSTYLANRNGQGVGFVRGVGLFRHEGDNARVRGGLVQPDPREPQGAVSVCQGVGFGRRAYSGGGVGIATLHGDGIQVNGSYFAQGCGYWHALGIFHLRGNRSLLQARRYSLGSGVHSAFGHLEIDGNENRVLNWGVGPAYGWDRGLGSAHIRGDKNEIQVEWGSGSAAIGGLSFSKISGNQNRFKLPAYGSGGFFNEEAAYSFHDIDGSDNMMEEGIDFSTTTPLYKMSNPWGALRLRGVRLVKNLDLEKPVWPELPQEPVRARERIDLQSAVLAAEKKPITERVGDWVDVAAAFSLDQETPRRALERLLAVPDQAADVFADVLEPEATDQLIRLRIAMSAFGEPSAKGMMRGYDNADLQKKGVFIAFLSRLEPDETLPFLFERAFQETENPRLKPGLIRSLGAALNKDTGQEPGMRAAYEALLNFLNDPKTQRKETESLLSRLRLAEAFGILSAVTPLTADKRISFLRAGPKDVTETIAEKGAHEMAEQCLAERGAAQARIKTILAVMTETEPKIHQELYGLLSSTNTAEAALAALVLGELGWPQDADSVAPLLTHSNPAVRKAAAMALARMTEPGMKILDGFFLSHAEERGLILAALPQAVSAESENLLYRGLKDADPQVRLEALSVFGSLPPVLEKNRRRLVVQTRKLLKKDTDPSVKWAVLLLR